MPGLVDLLVGLGERHKREAAEGKSADAFFNANPEALDKIGYQPDAYKNLGAVDRAGLMKGYLQSQGAQQAQAENQARVQQQQQMSAWLTERAQALSQQRDEDQFTGNLAGRLSQMTQPGPAPADEAGPPMSPDQGRPFMADLPGLPPGIDPSQYLPQGPQLQVDPKMAALLQAVAGAGRANPRVAAPLMRQLLPALTGNTDEGPVNFSEDPSSGMRFATRGKMMMPSGMNPAKVAPTLIPQHDEDGNLIGYSQVDPRGHAVFKAAVGGSELKPAIDASSGDEIPGFYLDQSGKLHDTRSAIQKISGGGGAAPAASKQLTPAQAKQFLQQAGGDKGKARDLAKKAGFKF